jgi:valyl-tRNA synthetase
MSLIMEVITALRNLRTANGLSIKEPISLLVKTATPEVFTRYRAMLDKMSYIDSLQFTDGAVAGAAGALVRTHELYVPLAGGIDPEAEKERITKEIAYFEGFLEQVMKKLGNEKFVANAAAAVVEKEQQKKADAETKLAMLRDSLKALMN